MYFALRILTTSPDAMVSLALRLLLSVVFLMLLALLAFSLLRFLFELKNVSQEHVLCRAVSAETTQSRQRTLYVSTLSVLEERLRTARRDFLTNLSDIIEWVSSISDDFLFSD